MSLAKGYMQPIHKNWGLRRHQLTPLLRLMWVCRTMLQWRKLWKILLKEATERISHAGTMIPSRLKQWVEPGLKLDLTLQLVKKVKLKEELTMV